ncbi:nuclear pore complex protein Nup107 [Anopheles nili]|uniref:nuclear pore complex protein Nup107 n=1 Tax=Anopheles nili TaxID=185578 RepID=UPI00237ACF69|nr:nuclear pore complex protein Nup107 [Anopheles nili]
MNKLERSLQLLDESTVHSNRGLLRSKDTPRSLLQQQFLGSPGLLDSVQDVAVYRTTESERGAWNGSQGSLNAGSTVSYSNANSKEVNKQLCEQFLEVLQRHSNASDVFEAIDELIELLDGTLVHMNLASKQLLPVGRERHMHAEGMWLNAERETWKLMGCLYRDRMVTQKQDNEMDDLPLLNSEQTIISHLYAGNGNLREYQMIVDWLEQMALQQNQLQMGHYTSRTVAWENTLHQLLEVGQTAFGSGRSLVKSLDPDAQVREKRPLHDLDTEDQARLAKQVFLEIRHGRLKEAQNKCEHCGQAWKAAVLEGWRLHHDPNYHGENATLIRNPIEGNPRRDLWKKFAWQMAESRMLDPYTKATVGSLCGNLESMVNVLSEHSWNDMLWAYLKVQIDIRVESEIRSHCIKSYLPMPDRYWNSKMSLEQIFDTLEAHKNAHISLAAKDVDKVIQKYIILDDIPELMRIVDGWLDGTEVVLIPQMLRFLTHFVMFLRQIGKSFQEDIGDKVIKRYVEHLIQVGEPHLVAFYTAALPPAVELLLYAQFLETISDSERRKKALEEAYNFGLDVPTITVYTVERYRAQEPDADDAVSIASGTLSQVDGLKISSLEWLTFYPDQRGELLWQANALTRYFLARRSIEAARKTFSVVPADTIEQIFTHYGSKDDIPCKEEVSIREYLCHQTYLAAIDGYNDWTQLFYNGKPKPPPAVAISNFTERVTSEHRETTYQKELRNWETRLTERTNQTRDLLYNVLLFPEAGWLVDTVTAKGMPENDEDWQNRAVQMENLRKLCIPEVVLLLHQLHALTDRHVENLLLADVLSSETRQLYSVFSKHKLAETLTKIAESSLTLMNNRKDPFVGDAAKK